MGNSYGRTRWWVCFQLRPCSRPGHAERARFKFEATAKEVVSRQSIGQPMSAVMVNNASSRTRMAGTSPTKPKRLAGERADVRSRARLERDNAIRGSNRLGPVRNHHPRHAQRPHGFIESPLAINVEMARRLI